MRSALLVAILISSSILLSAVRPGAAQTREAEPPQSQYEPPPVGAEMTLADAKAAQVRAAQLFRDQHYPEAADLLRRAYIGDPRPILLFNAGQAYRKAELPGPAKEMYEAFLRVVPEHALAPETRGYVKDMEALIATQSRAREVEQAAAVAAKKAALEIEKKRTEALHAQAELEKTQAQLKNLRKPIYRRGVFWAALGVGVIAIVVASGIGGFVSERTSTDGGTVEISR